MLLSRAGLNRRNLKLAWDHACGRTFLTTLSTYGCSSSVRYAPTPRLSLSAELSALKASLTPRIGSGGAISHGGHFAGPHRDSPARLGAASGTRARGLHVEQHVDVPILLLSQRARRWRMRIGEVVPV